MKETYSTGADFKVRDLDLAAQGRMKIDWAESRMPVMMALRQEHAAKQSLKGMRIAGCLHVTKETAVLIETLKAAGAEISWSGCNPLSTQDEVAAALAAAGISIYAWHGMNTEEFYWCIDKTLEFKPTLTLDDGADLIFSVHNRHPEQAKSIIGGTEETTTGVHRLRAMAADGALKYPVIAVNDAETKWDFDNVYGTGQSSLDGILRATSVLLAGKNFVVAGYGHCGAGCALRAAGMGANVIATEVKPTAALKALLNGHSVHEDGRRGAGRRHLHHRHRHEGRHRGPPLRGHEGRRHRLQHRPLRLRDQPRRARGHGQFASGPSATTARSTPWTTAGGSTCWPRAGW